MSCSDCIKHSAGLGDLQARLHQDDEFAGILPISGSIELTLTCNVRCKHCYILYPGATSGEMNTAQAKDVLEKIAAAGALFLLMTGGEVLTRPDFKELYLHAKRLGLLVTVYTNATLIDEDIIDFWKKYPPRKIEVTIYGHSEEVYEAVTNSRGSFKRFRKGVDLCVEAGLNLNLKSMILQTNLHEFHEMHDWAISKTGSWHFDRDINPRLDQSQDVLSERIAAEDYVELDAYFEGGQYPEHYKKSVMQTFVAETDNLFRCGAGVRTFHVDPKGQLHPCMLWRRNGYDLLENPIEEWPDHLQELRNLKNDNASGGCNSCTNRNTCGRCPAASALEFDDPTHAIPYFCGIAQERKRVYGKPMPLTLEPVSLEL